MQQRLLMTSCILNSIILVITCLVIIDGEVVDQNTCEVIDPSCHCFQPHALRCNLNSSSHLQDVLSSLNQNVIQYVKLLDLTVNKLRQIPSGLFANLSISGLLVSSGGSLTSIADGAFIGGQLEQTLVALKMPDNGFESLPSELSELRNLQSLDMSENAIWKIDNALLRSFDALEELNLGHNLLSTLDGLELPKSLLTFNVQNNQISLNGTRTFDFGGLNYLDLSNNKLAGSLSASSLGGTQARRPLKTLDLSFNALSKIEGGAFRLFPSLNKLNLKSNSLEILDQRSFENLPALNWLDLSRNLILELVSGTFDSLSGLIHLDLSFNHLQVLDGRLIQGLVSLTYFNLRSNNIFKVEKGIVENCPSCKTLILTENPLDCTCQLADFQAWLQTSNKLDRTTRREARCATPTSNANAILYNLSPLICSADSQNDDDISTFDIKTFDLPPVITLKNQVLKTDLLNLTWEVRLNIFKCQNLQIFSEDQDGIQQEVYSRPLDCERHHETPHGVDIVTTSLEISKIVSNNTSLLACLVLINEESESVRPPVVSGCGTVQLPPNNEAKKYEIDSTETVISLLHATLNFNSDSLLIFFRVQVTEKVIDSCKLELKVQNSDEAENVLAQQTISCSAQKFIFHQISRLIARDNFYEVCATIQHEEDGVYGANQFTSKCVSIEKEEDSSTANSQSTLTALAKPSVIKEPILPLILTLVFLAIGIAVLVVLYLIVRGYLTDRHRPGFLPEPAVHSGRTGKIVDSLVSSFFWTSDFLSWKHRRRRRHHAPVGDIDEMSLQDNLTITSCTID